MDALVPLLWIVGLALTGCLLAVGTFLVWHMLRARDRRDDRRDARDLGRPSEEPKR
jgi:hypothetical protein